MELIHDSSWHRISRTVNIIDGPVLPHPGNGANKRFRLTRLTVQFSLGSHGEWVSQQLVAQGPVLKADGTDSKTEFSDVVKAWVWKRAPEWAFAYTIIDGLRPTGNAELPFGPFDFTKGADVSDGWVR